MKLIFVSDLHASMRLPYAKLTEDGSCTDRLQDVLSIFKQVGDYAEQCKSAVFLFIVGDLFDEAHPDGPTLVHTSRALRELSSRVVTYLLPGNHDACDGDGRMYSLNFYGELDVPNLTVLSHGFIDFPGVDVYAVPWLPEQRVMKRVRAWEAEVDPDKKNILLLHQSIRGALWDSGIPSSEGLDPDEVTKGFDLVVSGHLHRPQHFGKRGIYCGAPLDLRFGDEEVPQRGFWVYDTVTDALDMVPTTYPRFETVRIRVDSELDIERIVAEELVDEDSAYVRFLVSGPAHLLDLVKTRVDFQDPDGTWGARYFRVEYTPDREEQVTRLDVDPTLSLSEMAWRYVVAREEDPDSVDALIKVGLSFLEDA